MTDEQFDRLYNLFSTGFGQLNHALQTIAEAMMQLENNIAQLAVAANPSPNYYKSLSEFADFDWATINAKVIQADDDGPSHVEWNQKVFQRRSGNPTFGAVIYFSRCTGKDAAGINKYERLITFKLTGEAVEVPKKTMKLAQSDQTTKENRRPAEPPAQTAPARQPQRIPIEETTERIAPPPTRPEPPANDGVSCSLPSWDKLNKTVVAANKAGVPPEKWKPKVKNLIGTDDMKTLNDADIAKATQIIAGMAETARAAGASAGVS